MVPPVAKQHPTEDPLCVMSHFPAHCHHLFFTPFSPLQIMRLINDDPIVTAALTERDPAKLDAFVKDYAASRRFRFCTCTLSPILFFIMHFLFDVALGQDLQSQ